jgi:AraC-like DNA-binding protein
MLQQASHFASKLLSFFVDMRELLHIPARLDGRIWCYRSPSRSNQRHHHAELELNLVTRGLGTYLLGNRRYQIRRGDLLWLFPAQEHVLFEQTPDFEMWIAVFKHKAIKRVATDSAARALLQNESSGECCRRLAHHELGRLEELFRDLDGTEERPGLLNAGLSYALLSAWRCFEGAADVPVRDVHPAVERAARLIQDGATTLGLEELAQRAGLSPARLSRLFKEQTGFAMVDFRNRQRVERFLEVYGTGQRQTMLDAALEAGFGSYPQFHRVFKAVTGSSPGDYRRRAIG